MNKRENAQRAASAPTSADALTEEELRAQDAEPLPGREVMSTLIWAPGPHAIAPEPIAPVDADDV